MSALAPLFAAALVCISPPAIDGDDIRCNGANVRLVAINARELTGKHAGGCNPGAPCPKASAESARDTLNRLTAGQRITCQPLGTNRGRTVARCRTSTGQDLSCEMSRATAAAPWPKYGKACL